VGVTTAETAGTPGSADDDALRAAVAARAPEGRIEQALAFAAAYVRRHDSAGRDGEDAAALGAEIASAFALADARGGAHSAVRAFTPRAGEHGYEPGVSVLQTNTADLPFLVDSVGAEIRAHGYAVARVVHPIVGVQRDHAGHIAAILHPREGARESVMHFELDRRLSPQELATLEDGVRAVLADIEQVVADFPAMRRQIDTLADLARESSTRYDDEDIEDAVAFLHWLRDDHFVFLGYREYEIVDGVWKVVSGSGLGLLHDDKDSRYATGKPLSQMTPALRTRATDGELVMISRTNRPSPVRRRERMDYVGIRRVGPNGEIIGEARLIGLFASKAYAEAASTIPLLKRKLQRILDAEDLFEGSHDYKAAMRLFDTFPKDEVSGTPTDDLRRAIVALLGLTGDEVRLLGRRSPDGRTATLIAALPRRRYDTLLRTRWRDVVAERFGTDAIETHEVFSDDDRVQYHLTVHDPEAELPEVSFEQLERELITLARTWDDAALDALKAAQGDERGAVLCARWLDRLPEAYRAATSPQLAAADIAGFDALHAAGGEFAIGLQDDEGRTRVAFYKVGAKVELSQATRLLEDLGLRVIEEIPTRLVDPEETWLQAFGVLGPANSPLDLATCGERVSATLTAAWHGEVESDSLHRLIVLSGVNHEQVEVLRAYRRYRQRIGSRYTEGYQNDVLAANAAVCEKQMRLFKLRFDPALARDEAAEEQLRQEIRDDLDAVALLDHDRILRNQLGLIDATVRTTVYRAGRGAIAFKLRSAEVPAIPLPAPLFEIYVYAPDMEGIHLRGGMIARGGIRWSERMDYRTEVFGLMRAQMTKNAVIVPAGAKGGFYLRNAPAPGPALKDAVKAGYMRYIEALLDLTDDLEAGGVVHPDGVRVLDGDDTYFVVAADKGTATFSDTANAIAERRGFWLGDAFASGGSAGYDHKALGITARGAWESVKRHFRGLGMDPAVDSFSVVGIGDMSGDVFGNGMLLSDRIGLVAAYDHRHIFIDPAPDPDVSFAERKRLFELAGSSWDDYDRDKLSAGGGVFPRTAKSVALSDQARSALGIDDAELAPTDLIRAVLRAPVDLLWNGGIGTVVKASSESDADALDRSSDAIRVDADQLRCRVIGEGGNLGLTQRARIEAAQHGVLVNADFIDNSAGVDCSDHEVNLKILLGQVSGELDRPARDALLEQVTGDVTAHVLYDSFQQAQVLAQEVQGSAARLYAYEDLMNLLEGSGLLLREVERLPGNDDLAERRRAGSGLVLPELSVLLAYAKRQLTDALLDCALLDDPVFDADLHGYFPPAIVERFGEQIPAHRLRRELAATIASNDVVNALGPTFVSRLQTERGAEVPAIVRAYRVACIATRARERWSAIEALDGALEPDVYWTLLGGVDALVEGVARWELANGAGGAIAAAGETGRAGFDALWAVLPQLRTEEWRASAESVVQELSGRGAPEDLARAHAMQGALVHAPDIIAAAARTERSVEDVAAAFFALGDELRLEWLEQLVGGLSVAGRMQRWAASALGDDVLAVRRALAEAALLESPDTDPVAAVSTFLESRAARLQRLRNFSRTLAAEDNTDLAGLTLAVRQLRALAA
jgi:glutamate dehydrogenase